MGEFNVDLSGSLVVARRELCGVRGTCNYCTGGTVRVPSVRVRLCSHNAVMMAGQPAHGPGSVTDYSATDAAADEVK